MSIREIKSFLERKDKDVGGNSSKQRVSDPNIRDIDTEIRPKLDFEKPHVKYQNLENSIITLNELLTKIISNEEVKNKILVDSIEKKTELIGIIKKSNFFSKYRGDFLHFDERYELLFKIVPNFNGQFAIIQTNTDQFFALNYPKINKLELNYLIIPDLEFGRFVLNNNFSIYNCKCGDLITNSFSLIGGNFEITSSELSSLQLKGVSSSQGFSIRNSTINNNSNFGRLLLKKEISLRYCTFRSELSLINSKNLINITINSSLFNDSLKIGGKFNIINVNGDVNNRNQFNSNLILQNFQTNQLILNYSQIRGLLLLKESFIERLFEIGYHFTTQSHLFKNLYLRGEFKGNETYKPNDTIRIGNGGFFSNGKYKTWKEE